MSRHIYAQEDFSHGAGLEAGEGFLQVGEGMDGVDQGGGVGAGEGGDNLLPGGARFGGGVGADGDAAEAEAAEEEGGGVEFGDGAGEAADATDAAVVGEGFEEWVERGAADVVDCEVDAAAAEEFLDAAGPLGVVGVDGQCGAEVAE